MNQIIQLGFDRVKREWVLLHCAICKG